MSTPNKSRAASTGSKKVYAVLGATGFTGRQLVKHLLEQQDIQLHLYVRSASKLNAQDPTLTSHPSVTIHCGDLDDTVLLANCLRECSVIFSTVATNINAPDTSIAQRTAHSVAAALQLIRKENNETIDNGRTKWRCPLVIMLSAGTINEKLFRVPKPVGKFLYTSLKYIYDDLKEAAKYFREEQPWIPMIQAQPAALVEGKASAGYVKGCEENPSSSMTYADLARGMILLADERSQWTGKDVGFVVEHEAGFPIGMLKSFVQFILPGLCYSLFPSIYWLTHRS